MDGSLLSPSRLLAGFPKNPAGNLLDSAQSHFK